MNFPHLKKIIERKKKRIGLVFSLEQDYQRQFAQGALEFFRENRRCELAMLGGQIVHPLARQPLLKVEGQLGHFYPDSPVFRDDKDRLFLTTSNFETSERLSCVCSDDEAVGRMGATYLAELGYKNLAFFGHRRSSAFRERWNGFSVECRKRGIEPIDYTDGVFAAKFMRNWRKTQNSILEALRKLPKPSAIMAADDQVGIAIMQIALHHNYKIPLDFALLGVNDDSIQLDLLPIPMSSIQLNGKKIGFEAGKLLSGQLHQETALNQRIKVPPLRVVERRSTDVVYCGDPALEKILLRMKASISEPVSIPDLIAGAGMSRATFDRRFHERIGSSPYQFMLSLRFRRAEDLLLNSRKSVSEIAAACGFQKVHDFSARFRAYKGLAPTQFRSTHLSLDPGLRT